MLLCLAHGLADSTSLSTIGCKSDHASSSTGVPNHFERGHQHGAEFNLWTDTSVLVEVASFTGNFVADPLKEAFCCSYKASIWQPPRLCMRSLV